MLPRRGKTPPYEIMRAAQQAASPAHPARRVDDERLPADPSAAWWSWAGVGTPIILRVPRGIAACAAVALLGLLVLAYWAGHSRGSAATLASLDPSQPLNLQRTAPALPLNASQLTTNATTRPTSASPSPSRTPDSGPRTSDSPSADPRLAGLNYARLALLPRSDAQRLADFLQNEGVETILDSVDNDRFHVVAVDQGFAANELGSDAKRAYENRLRAAGRAWKRHNNNRGDALEDLYFAKYEPKN